ncbi:MAG: DUF484 family protein [Pacificimonas sp.]
MNIVQFDPAARRLLSQRAAQMSNSNAALSHYAAGTDSMMNAVSAAILQLMTAESLPDIIRTVTLDWPKELGVDMAALALASHDEGFRAGPTGIQRLPARRIRAWSSGTSGAEVRNVEGGVPLFGDAGADVRSVAVIPLALPAPLGVGVLALGSAAHSAPPAMDGTACLDFLGQALSRMIAACLMKPPSLT